MRRSDGQSFQPLSVHFPSPSLFPFFPSFSTISGIVLETRLIVYFFAPDDPPQEYFLLPREFASKLLKQIVPLGSSKWVEDGRKERAKIAIGSSAPRFESWKNSLNRVLFSSTCSSITEINSNCNPLWLVRKYRYREQAKLSDQIL